MTTAERTERRDEARQAIREAVARLMDEESFRRWLEIRSRFHRYSFGNVLLIAAQRPEATRVAGYKAWQTKFGRNVRKGEKAIRIMAPVVVKRRDEETGDVRPMVVGFRGTCVFDVAQTEGEPLPDPPACVHPAGDDLAGHLPALEGHARELGYVVSYSSAGDALGYCDHIARRIVVSDELSPNARVSTLVHEIAHAHGIGYKEHPRAECEVIVEATTAIVLGTLGYDVSGFSVPYIASWGQTEESLDALERFATTIDVTARKIEDALGLGKLGRDGETGGNGSSGTRLPRR